MASMTAGNATSEARAKAMLSSNSLRNQTCMAGQVFQEWRFRNEVAADYYSIVWGGVIADPQAYFSPAAASRKHPCSVCESWLNCQENAAPELVQLPIAGGRVPQRHRPKM